MNLYRKVFLTVLAIVTLWALAGVPAVAENPAELSAESSEAAAQDSPPGPAGSSSDPSWRFDLAPYVYVPGIHGTVGALGHDVSVHVSGSDVLSSFNGGLAGIFEADKGRFVMPINFFWARLATTNDFLLTDLDQRSARLELNQTIFNPMAGFRVADTEHFKVDALFGLRYWYLGQTITLRPSQLSGHASGNWVDAVAGARFIVPLSPKAWITVSGDAGGGGSNLDYQVGGLLTIQPKPLLGFLVGWAYLDVDRRGSKDFIYDVAMSGPVIGLNFTFGGTPPIPPSASCSAQPTEVWSGDPVRVSATGANFNPKHTLTYGWTQNGGKLSSTNTQTATVDTEGMSPGSYSAVATITDPREKKNNSATCTANFSIKQPQPPVVSCSANPTTIAIGQPSTITMTATDPQGWPMTYSWSTSGGQLSGSGTSATVTAANADAGNTITVTGTATTTRSGLSSSCTAQVNVPPVVKCVNIEDWGECTFEKNPKKPWRVDNDCKDTLDRLSLRLQQMPNGKLDIVGYTNEKESVSEQTLGAQRSVNIKYYLTTDGPNKADASRIQPRAGGTKGQVTRFYFVPEGTLCGGQLEEGTVVDESRVQPQSRTALAPQKRTKRAAPAPSNQ
jgi:hypothetical protein